MILFKIILIAVLLACGSVSLYVGFLSVRDYRRQR